MTSELSRDVCVSMVRELSSAGDTKQSRESISRFLARNWSIIRDQFPMVRAYAEERLLPKMGVFMGRFYREKRTLRTDQRLLNAGYDPVIAVDVIATESKPSEIGVYPFLGGKSHRLREPAESMKDWLFEWLPFVPSVTILLCDGTTFHSHSGGQADVLAKMLLYPVDVAYELSGSHELQGITTEDARWVYWSGKHITLVRPHFWMNTARPMNLKDIFVALRLAGVSCMDIWDPFVDSNSPNILIDTIKMVGDVTDFDPGKQMDALMYVDPYHNPRSILRIRFDDKYSPLGENDG